MNTAQQFREYQLTCLQEMIAKGEEDFKEGRHTRFESMDEFEEFTAEILAEVEAGQDCAHSSHGR